MDSGETEWTEVETSKECSTLSEAVASLRSLPTNLQIAAVQTVSKDDLEPNIKTTLSYMDSPTGNQYEIEHHCRRNFFSAHRYHCVLFKQGLPGPCKQPSPRPPSPPCKQPSLQPPSPPPSPATALPPRTMLECAVMLVAESEFRAKSMKVFQNLAKLCAAFLGPSSSSGEALRGAAKKLSHARRLAEWLKWLRYVKGFQKAHAKVKKGITVSRVLGLAEAWYDITIDVLNDILTLQWLCELQFPGRSRVVPMWLEWLADRQEIPQAAISFALAIRKLVKLHVTPPQSNDTKVQRKITIQKTAALRFICDFIRAIMKALGVGGNRQMGEMLDCSTAIISALCCQRKISDRLGVEI